MGEGMTDAVAMKIAAITIDPAIYPRVGGVRPATVERYADALAEGEQMPPVIIEARTHRLLDGHHRLQAHVRNGSTTVEVLEDTVPSGLTAKLYAASLQTGHGLPLVEDDEKALARELYEQGDVTAAAVAKALHRPRRTVEGWVDDLAQDRRAAEEHARSVRRTLMLLLRDLGWTQQSIADALGVSQPLVTKGLIHKGDPAVMNSEAVLRAAVAAAPADVAADVAALADRWREDRIFATWSDDERDLVKHLRGGETVVVNMRGDAHGSLWRWAEQAGLAVRIDRKSVWGNPFLVDDDGTREEVCTNYAELYWPLKRSLHGHVGSLAGKALGCWCAPAQCHGDFLREQVHQ